MEMINNIKIKSPFMAHDSCRYVKYWKERFKEKSVTDFCTAIQTNSLHTDKRKI